MAFSSEELLPGICGDSVVLPVVEGKGVTLAERRLSICNMTLLDTVSRLLNDGWT